MGLLYSQLFFLNNNIKIASYTERDNKYISPINTKIDYSLFSYIHEKTILLKTNKKVYNQ